MDLGFILTRAQANVLGMRETLEATYSLFPDVPQFWGMIDLADSSNFRLVRGPKEGYIRAETFFGLVREIVAPCARLRVLKELGDGVLLVSEDFRQMFETAVLIDQVSRQMRAVAGSEGFPFAVRCGIGFGFAKRIHREREDYVGSPIDQLARLMSVRAERGTIVLHEDGYRVAEALLREYGALVSVSDVRLLGGKESKSMAREVWYRELTIDEARVPSFSECFVPWKEGLKRAGEHSTS